MEELLTQLKLGRIREVYRDWIDRASKEEMGHAEWGKSPIPLSGLLSEEVCARQALEKLEQRVLGASAPREENQIKRRMQQAGFPFEKTIEQFDFSLRPELKRQVILNCMDETFVHQGRSMVLIGPPGTGKTHLSVSVGIKMIQLGYMVKFVMAQRLINEYIGFKNTSDRQKLMRSLAKVDLLIIDEFGYLPHDKEAGSLFYQVISDRYERKGTIITSNKGLRSWAEVIHDSSLATALIDRLMHHGEVFYLSGDSYRLRGKKKFLEDNVPTPELWSESETEMADCQVK